MMYIKSPFSPMTSIFTDGYRYIPVCWFLIFESIGAHLRNDGKCIHDVRFYNQRLLQSITSFAFYSYMTGNKGRRLRNVTTGLSSSVFYRHVLVTLLMYMITEIVYTCVSSDTPTTGLYTFVSAIVLLLFTYMFDGRVSEVHVIGFAAIAMVFDTVTKQRSIKYHSNALLAWILFLLSIIFVRERRVPVMLGTTVSMFIVIMSLAKLYDSDVHDPSYSSNVHHKEKLVKDTLAFLALVYVCVNLIKAHS